MYTTLISAQELQQIQQQNQPVLLLDVRFDLNDATFGQQVYELGHIPGAFYLHLERELSGQVSGHNGRHPLPERKHLAHWLRNHGLQERVQVVAYDQGSTMFAARAWALVRWLGHEQVAVLNGGLPAWLREGGTLSNVAPQKPVTTDWQPQESLLHIKTASDIEHNIQMAEAVVIDARSEERYAGEPHPLDKVSGHIPGAANVFFQRNLDGQHLFISQEQLKALWQPWANNKPLIHQCGSGVSACVNLLAQKHAGLGDGALYVGSWSEWTSNGQRPVSVTV
ncbi:sulfurtransferase [Vitreoscilla stercoraria]|uniref:Sulfurtransferase n=1 Tax=Vitreoscilla stercoraria TaxID=61 RepID=A0ABY4E854_VITST|nr:sulfurtransferase [Vitreoscilla stercoraria]UOO91942.1 sulfurtransferase [Vitreoscilla stercoraria]